MSPQNIGFHPIMLAVIGTLLFAKLGISIGQDKSASPEKTEFTLHPAKLDALFHRAATMALLKAKARETLRAVPSQMERIVFRECVRDGGAQSPAKYAKCLVKLFRARGNEVKYVNEQPAASTETGLFGGTMNWLTELAKGFAQKVPIPLIRNGPKQLRTLKKTTKNKEKQKRKKWWRKWPSKWLKRARARLRRAIEGSRIVDGKLPKNIRALRVIQRHLDRLEWAQSYVRGMSQESASALKPFLAQPIRFAQSSSAVLPLLSQVQAILNGTGAKSSLSLLSPRLLSLFPSAKNKPKLLSPELFSFNREGFLPLPQLFGMLSPNEHESLEWLDFVLELTGAGKQLATLLERMRPEMDEFEQKIMPALERARAQDEQWKQLKSSLNGAQKRQLTKRGFVHLEKWQQEMLFDERKLVEGKRKSLEAKIEQLAKLADLADKEGAVLEAVRKRVRRGEDEEDNDDDDNGRYNSVVNSYLLPNTFISTTTTTNSPTPAPIGSSVILGNDSNGVMYVPFGNSPDTEDNITVVPRTVALTPWAFEQRLGGVILEGVYLSPHAFSSELVSPEVLTVKVASPSAFMAAILSPMALTARIVSPSAFRAQILSPEALSAYVLNPDVFLAEILSPNVMQTRVLSPKALFVQILSPMIASPRLGSPQVGGLVVLSPNFLSPRIYSQEAMQVEVLSPHILGGEHEPAEVDRWMPDGGTHYVGFPSPLPTGSLDASRFQWG